MRNPVASFLIQGVPKYQIKSLVGGTGTGSQEPVYICPQSATMIFLEVLPDWEPKDSTFFTTSMPSTTCPKTTCLPSSHWVLAVQRKNCEPLVLGPALAMERTPGPVCLRVKFSSSNLLP